MDIDLSGNIYVLDIDNKLVQKFTKDGVFVTNIGVGRLSSSVISIAVNHNTGIVYVGDKNIEVFVPSRT
jgi:hypothetical protein